MLDASIGDCHVFSHLLILQKKFLDVFEVVLKLQQLEARVLIIV